MEDGIQNERKERKMEDCEGRDDGKGNGERERLS